ncbi:Unknown protein, partial [Striga hermonthica]
TLGHGHGRQAATVVPAPVPSAAAAAALAGRGLSQPLADRSEQTGGPARPVRTESEGDRIVSIQEGNSTATSHRHRTRKLSHRTRAHGADCTASRTFLRRR